MYPIDNPDKFLAKYEGKPVAQYTYRPTQYYEIISSTDEADNYRYTPGDERSSRQHHYHLFRIHILDEGCRNGSENAASTKSQYPRGKHHEG